MVSHKFYEPLFEETYRYFYKEDEQGNGYLVNEFTLDDWKKYVSDKTMFFKNQRVGAKAKQNTKSGRVDRRNGQEVKVAQVVDYDFDRNILTILTEPTFNFDAWTYPNGAKGTYGPNQGATKDNVYTIEVEFIDIDKWRDKPWPEISLSDWKEMMQVVDVKWNCTCMSFYWQSHRHELTTLDGAIYPYTGPDKGIWKKRHGNRSGLCKHLAAIAPLVGGFQASIVLGKIRDAAKRKGIKESVKLKEDNVIYYHGTNQDFKVFDKSKIGSTTDEGMLGKGFYFSTDPRIADNNKIRIHSKLTFKNPLILYSTRWGENKTKLLQKGFGIDTNKKVSIDILTTKLRQKGYDSVILDYSPLQYFQKEVMVLNTNQIQIVRKEINT